MAGGSVAEAPGLDQGDGHAGALEVRRDGHAGDPATETATSTATRPLGAGYAVVSLVSIQKDRGSSGTDGADVDTEATPIGRRADGGCLHADSP